MRRPSLTHVMLLTAIAVALIVLAFRFEQPGEIEVIRQEAPGGLDQIVVHISGAVRVPGVYVVQPGDRVADAVELAGGLNDDADPRAVNLALRLRDEDHVHIPSVMAGIATTQVEALLDLNTATMAELESLPGIGPVYAGRIIDARVVRPFASSDELLEREVIPARTYEGIRLLVTASVQ